MLTRRTVLRAALAAAAACTVPGCAPRVGRSGAQGAVQRTMPFERIAYGGDPQQYGELRRPGGAPAPVVVVVHGGFWLSQYDLGLMVPVCRGAHTRGLRDVERRVSPAGRSRRRLAGHLSRRRRGGGPPAQHRSAAWARSPPRRHARTLGGRTARALGGGPPLDSRRRAASRRDRSRCVARCRSPASATCARPSTSASTPSARSWAGRRRTCRCGTRRPTRPR